MQFSGTSSVLLPQVSQFGFCLTGMKVSDTGVINIIFTDIGSSMFSFTFSGGVLSTNKPVATYNTKDTSTISGYVNSGVLNYLVNGIFGQQNISFSQLNSVTVQTNTSTLLADLLVSSNPINYSVSFPPTYQCYGILTGNIVSDTPFPIHTPTYYSYKSNQVLLSGNYSTGLYINTGSNNFKFNDVDPALYEYQNYFYLSLPTTFGDIGGNFNSYRSGVVSQSVISFTPSDGNVYAITSLFDGIWSGEQFVYIDNPATYGLGFNYSSYSFNAQPNNSTLNLSFTPISPANSGSYNAQYVSGFTLTSSGKYQTLPTIQFSQYYYVTGLQNALQTFLFSTGCTGAIPISFSGGSPTSNASGKLYLSPVRLSGIYTTGIANFMIASGYSGISSGAGYQTPPIAVFGTGGGCYSLPDKSGYQTAQFQFTSGYGAVYAQAAGLTGLALTYFDGAAYYVTGIQVTNIGFGYSSGFSPNVTFQRVSGDIFSSGYDFIYDITGSPILDISGNPIIGISSTGLANNASGSFQFKQSGLYLFENFWNIAYNVGTGLNYLSGNASGYSGSVGLYADGNISIQINCSGLDNTSAISGLLTVNYTAGASSTTQQYVIYQSRTFDLNTGAMSPNVLPPLSYIPLPNLSYVLNNDPFDAAFQNGYNGGTVNDILTF